MDIYDETRQQLLLSACEAPEEDKGEIQEAPSNLGAAREILSDLDAIFTLTRSDPVHRMSAFTFMTSERFSF